MLEEPAVILALVTLAAGLAVVEVALPTLGVAGVTATVSVLLAGIGIDRTDATWWPLVGAAVAVVVWMALIVARRRSRAAEAVAITAYAAGSFGFAAANSDGPAYAVAAACTLALAVAFPPLHRGATRPARCPGEGRHGVVRRPGRASRPMEQRIRRRPAAGHTVERDIGSPAQPRRR